MKFSTYIAIYFLLCLSQVQAQRPIEVQRLTADQNYSTALTTHYKMPSRRITAASAVAASKSAWALGLPSDAIYELERALRLGERSNQLSRIEKIRIYFSRGVIEFQEKNFQLAIVYAEKALKFLVKAGPLKSQVLLLKGDSSLKLNKLSIAENAYQMAIDGLSDSDQGEAYYMLASCQMQLGKLKEARANLKSIPLHHTKSPLAIRSLATIAFETEQYEEAIFWLNEGREKFKDYFLDSWVDYALVKAFINLNEVTKVHSVHKGAVSKYPTSDPWLILLNATVEAFEWRKLKAVKAMPKSEIFNR